MSKAGPNTSMGSRRAVEVCACLWVDMLGYGAMLREDNFDITKQTTKAAIERLFQFQDIIAKHSMKLFPTVVLNDGCVAYRNLSPRSKSVTYDFLRRAHLLHTALNEQEKSQGYPGVRSILAAGFRHRRPTDSKERLLQGLGRRLIDSVKRGDQSIEQAVISALFARTHYDLVPQLQANFAFSKAYLADAEGSKGGFAGPNFFIDANLVPSAPPNWFKSERTVTLAQNGLGGDFFQITNLKFLSREVENTELLDAFEVASKIAGSDAVADRIRKLTLSGGRHKYA